MKKYSKEWWFWNIATIVGGVATAGIIWFIVSGVVVIWR